MYKIKTGLSQEEKSYAEKLEALVVSGKRVSTIDEYSLRGGSTHSLMTHLREDTDKKAIDLLLIDTNYGGRAVIIAKEKLLEMVGNPPKIPAEGMTMTAIKRGNGFSYLVDVEKNIALCRFELKDGTAFYPWETVHVIKAQTLFDMNYRKEWLHGELMFEGNNYGDTSTFYAVGVIQNR